MASPNDNQAGHSVPVGTSAVLVHAGQISPATAGLLLVGGNPFFATTINDGYRYPAPRQGTIRNGKLRIVQNLTGGSTYRVTIQVNSADILTLDVTRNGATGVFDIPGTTSVASEDLVSVLVNDTLNPGGAMTFQGLVTYEFV